MVNGEGFSKGISEGGGRGSFGGRDGTPAPLNPGGVVSPHVSEPLAGRAVLLPSSGEAARVALPRMSVEPDGKEPAGGNGPGKETVGHGQLPNSEAQIPATLGTGEPQTPGDVSVPPLAAGPSRESRKDSGFEEEAAPTAAQLTSPASDTPTQRGTADQFGIISFHEAYAPVPPGERDEVRSIFGPRVDSLFAAHEDFVDHDIDDKGVVSESLSLSLTIPDSHKLSSRNGISYPFGCIVEPATCGDANSDVLVTSFQPLSIRMDRMPDTSRSPLFCIEVVKHDGEEIIRDTAHHYYPDPEGAIIREDVDIAQLLAGKEHVPLVFGDADAQTAAMNQINALEEQARKGREDEKLLGINKQPVGLDEVTSVLGLAEQAAIPKVSFYELQLRNFKRLEEPGPSLEEAAQAGEEFGDIVDRFLNRNQAIAQVDENGNRKAMIETTSEDGTTFSVHVTQTLEASGRIVPIVTAILKPSSISKYNSKYSASRQKYWVDDKGLVSSTTNFQTVHQPNYVTIERSDTASTFIGKDDARRVRNFLHDPQRKLSNF